MIFIWALVAGLMMGGADGLTRSFYWRWLLT